MNIYSCITQKALSFIFMVGCSKNNLAILSYKSPSFLRIARCGTDQEGKRRGRFKRGIYARSSCCWFLCLQMDGRQEDVVFALEREKEREREGGEGRGSESKKSYQRRWKEAACRKGLYLGDLLFCPHLGRTNILEHAILFFHSRFLGNSATHLSGASKNRAEREKS
jgi:hypothetical protein